MVSLRITSREQRICESFANRHKKTASVESNIATSTTPTPSVTLMTTSDPLDLARAHRHFAAACFNATWDLIDKAERTDDDDRRMVATCHASIYHWLERSDCTPQNLSIGYWQLARVYVLVGDAPAALAAARVSLGHSGELAPFYLAYAHEAVARAAVLGADLELAATHVAAAHELARHVTDVSSRDALLADLATISI